MYIHRYGRYVQIICIAYLYLYSHHSSLHSTWLQHLLSRLECQMPRDVAERQQGRHPHGKVAMKSRWECHCYSMAIACSVYLSLYCVNWNNSLS